MNTRIIGIDLAVNAAHKAVILDQERNEFIGAALSFRANPAEMERLLATAQAGAMEPVRLVAVLEATGMSWYMIGSYLMQHGVVVYRVNGQLTAAQRKVYQCRAKSDRIDARVLARMYLTIPERLYPLYLPDAAHLTLQRACREVDRLTHLATASHNRLRATDELAWLQVQGVWPEQAEQVRWLREHWYNPWKVVEAGVQTLQDHWRQCFPELEEATWLGGLVAQAQQVVDFYGHHDWLDYEHLQASQSREQTRLDNLRAACDQLRQVLVRPLYHQLHPQRYLESLYGIGEDSAAIYIAFIGDIYRFPTAAHFRSWCGLIPFSNQSGETQVKGLHITQAGPDLIKKTVFLNTEVARLYDPQIAACYYHQMVHKGKHHLQAVCACASHLLNRIFAVLRDQRPYQLRDLAQHPLDKSQARHLCQEKYRLPEEVRRRNNARSRHARSEQLTEQRYLHLLKQKRSKG